MGTLIFVLPPAGEASNFFALLPLPFHQPPGLCCWVGTPRVQDQGKHPISHTLGMVWVTALSERHTSKGGGLEEELEKTVERD